jgi:Trp operon repressor
MKPKYQQANEETTNIKNELFKLVVTRDEVGEAMWYIYTGLLLTSIVQLKITTRGCINNPKTMESNYKDFLNKEKQTKDAKELATSTTYTITN